MKCLHGALGLALFALSALAAASLTTGCDECVGISCEDIYVDNGTYRLVADTPPSWALDVGEVTLTDTRLTVNYTDLDDQAAQAVWAVRPLDSSEE